MIIGSKICQHGPDRKKNEKPKSSTQKIKYERQFIHSCHLVSWINVKRPT